MACFTFYYSTIETFELSCCANKNTNTLIINVLVSERKSITMRKYGKIPTEI